MFRRIFFAVYILIIFSCSEDCQEDILPPESRIGAIYISCESPSWRFDFDSLISCEQDELTLSELNPENACPMSDIQIQEGEVEISFSENPSLGRIYIQVSSDIFMEDENENPVSEIYVNDNENWFFSKNDIRLKLTIENVYVGGCFHELIRWEEL